MSLKEKKSKDHAHIFGSAYVYKTAKSDWVRVIPPEIGDIKYSVRSDNHAGWLKCDGSAISRSTYNDLFAVIDTDFGVGDGLNTFNLPDARGRVLGGVGTGRNNNNSANLTPRARGAKVGDETHTLTTAEMPQHTHGNNSIAGSLGLMTANGSNTAGGDIDVDGSAPYEPNLYTTPAALTIDNAGGGGAHNNMQPTLFISNVFIFATHQTDLVPS
jgi:microcystin-dependent protein